MNKEFPIFKSFQGTAEMMNILSRVSTKNLEEKVKNPKTDFSTCCDAIHVFDMLIDNNEITVLKELFTPEEFQQFWTGRYQFETMAASYCDARFFETISVKRIKKLLKIKDAVLE